ncbi:MAG: undecaprenyldiphospho-muramoylpentapeptide beta-N-acetylglucosaminyltransferase [Odoribacteraceae bacterium]|jgi:UDP-N-acetylglucosamine--N-acetylmuramyl-(pentapeptide) pyrophosphoryl-undecaprenol N-acetylglucosamine transferase|nr:undecaprenyldiphospho-muramoylpentapeptide beta-N-acetylglucosaminyltransferase [Odoribacteraceae bacterium]
MKKMRKIIISGGGTGGHVFPAIAIANALRRSGQEVEILFVGAEGKMEMEKVPEAGYPIEGLPVRGFQRRLTWKNVMVMVNLYKSMRAARRIVRHFRPDVVVGVGGYASGPVGRVAARRGIPLVLQEQNSYAGVTNRLLAKHAVKVCVAYEGMERFFGAGRVVFTGNPVRAELLQSLNAREEGIALHGLDPRKKTVLITGGSQGAGSINRAMERWLATMGAWEGVQVLWQCGSFYHAGLAARLEGQLPPNVVLLPFLKRMDLAYACADWVVARAGAGTISELCLLGKATVLVPSPNVAEDHQRKNALALVDKGAAVMIEDRAVEERLGTVLAELLEDDARRFALSMNIRALGIADADDRIARIVLAVGDKTEQDQQ